MAWNEGVCSSWRTGFKHDAQTYRVAVKTVLFILSALALDLRMP